MAGAGSPWLIEVLAAGQFGLILVMLARRGGAWRAAAFGCFVLAGAALVVLPGRLVAQAAGGACHAAAYAGLLAWFAGSLAPAREPVVTGLARRMRRSTPPEVVAYTRGVTRAWCVFFAAELLASAALLLLAPRPVWAGFVSLGNLPAIAAMMLGEFAVRSLRFGHGQRTSLAATLAGLRQFRP